MGSACLRRLRLSSTNTNSHQVAAFSLAKPASLLIFFISALEEFYVATWYQSSSFSSNTNVGSGLSLPVDFSFYTLHLVRGPF